MNSRDSEGCVGLSQPGEPCRWGLGCASQGSLVLRHVQTYRKHLGHSHPSPVCPGGAKKVPSFNVKRKKGIKGWRRSRKRKRRRRVRSRRRKTAVGGGGDITSSGSDQRRSHTSPSSGTSSGLSTSRIWREEFSPFQHCTLDMPAILMATKPDPCYVGQGRAHHGHTGWCSPLVQLKRRRERSWG